MRRVVMLGALVLVGVVSVIGVAGQQGQMNLEVDRLEDNLNPVGRVFYSASTFICTPASRSQEVGLCLGAQSGEARMRSVVQQGGFSRFRRAAQTPFNLIYEARP